MSKPTYEVIFVNNSGESGDVLVYARKPDYQSMAWLTKPTYPSGKVTIDWKEEYGFAWTAKTSSGSASQVLPTDLATNNQVTLAFSQEQRSFYFTNQEQGPPQGQMLIKISSSIPAGYALTGMAIYDSPAIMIDAQPGTTVSISPSGEYWIAFGQFVQRSVVDISSISQAVQFTFPSNVYSLTATLDRGKNITVKNTPLPAV